MRNAIAIVLCMIYAGVHGQANTKEAGRRLWVASLQRDIGCVSFALSPVTAAMLYASNQKDKASPIASASWFFSFGMTFQFGANRQERKAALLLQQWP